MTYLTIDLRYPNIADLFAHPTFTEPYSRGYSSGRKINDWCNFWNLTGARSSSIGHICGVCGARYRKKGRKNKQVNLCSHCLKSKNAKERFSKCAF
jgi:hypothetical protein